MVIGQYCKSFSDATHAMPQGVSLNAPYRFHWLKVVKVEGGEVHCTGAGEAMQFKIRRERNSGREFFDLTIKDPIFGPLQFKTYAFKGEDR